MNKIENKDIVKRECELKFAIKDNNEKKNVINKLNRLGFKLLSKNIETDYTPDVENFICKENGLILRFRIEDGETHRILLTLKVAKENCEFQENYELEFYFDEFDQIKFKLLNQLLYKYVKIRIPKKIIHKKSISDIRELLKEKGFVKQRTLIQKKRSEYRLNNIKITIDEFPANIGTYLEIETSTNSTIKKAVKLLELDSTKAINKKYGKIIKEKQANLPEEKRGICVFTEIV